MMTMKIRFLEITVLASLFLMNACATGTAQPALCGGEAGSGGTGGSGGMGAGGSGGSGGTGGPDVDPLEGAGPVELVLGGFQFTEGPLWRAADGILLFTDIPGNAIHTLVPPSMLGIYRDPSGNANGLAFDSAGLLIACEHGNRRVSRTMQDQTIVDVAIEWTAKKLNSPNDAIVGPEGSVYFTDPPYGLADPGLSELGFFGVFRVDPVGMMSLVADDMPRPNGIALSPDHKNLYVTDTQLAEVRVFPVAGFGQTGPGTKLMTTAPGPDGMAVDDAGNLYIATSVGIEVYRSNGMLRGKIDVLEQATNCSFGGMERKTLYITAGTSLYRVDLGVPGLP
jgi:gluconolactonase